MIKVTLFTHHQNPRQFIGFCIEGHATDAPHGSSLLCAGISTLGQSVMIAIKDNLKIQMQLQKRPGYLKCIASPLTQKDKQQIHLLMNVIASGVHTLQKQYPQEIISQQLPSDKNQ